MKNKLYEWLKEIRLLLKNIKSLNLYEKLTLSISAVGALSLFFIVIQIMLTRDSMKATMYQTMNTQTLEMDRTFIQYPETRPYFYEGRDPSEITDENKRNRVMMIAEYQLDFFDLVMTQSDYVPRDKDSREDKRNWDTYFADSFAKSPVLCQRIRQNPGWYMKRLEDIAKVNCK